MLTLLLDTTVGSVEHGHVSQLLGFRYSSHPIPMISNSESDLVANEYMG